MHVIDPVELDDFFIAFFSAAMIILMGAAYALFFAFSKLQRRKLFAVSAYFSYGLLVISVFFLSDALNLNGYWQFLVWLMLAGYLLAPHGIWHLCRGTHADQLEPGSINDFRGQINNMDRTKI